MSVALQATHSIVDGWLVVETQPRKEAFALANLKRQSFRTFHPRFWKTRRHARKCETQLAPLFPGYLFVRPDDEARSLRTLSGTFGVRRMVGAELGRPAHMPPEAMAALFARCENQVVTSVVEPKPGSDVRFLRGPLSDCLATVEAIDTKGRLQLLVQMLNQTVQIEVDPSVVGPV